MISNRNFFFRRSFWKDELFLGYQTKPALNFSSTLPSLSCNTALVQTSEDLDRPFQTKAFVAFSFFLLPFYPVSETRYPKISAKKIEAF